MELLKCMREGELLFLSMNKGRKGRKAYNGWVISCCLK
jgi:hypothetical protein